jgi:hypothetical protein
VENTIARAKEVSADLATLEHFGIITMDTLEKVVIQMVVYLDKMHDAHREKNKTLFMQMHKRLWALAANVRKAVETFTTEPIDAVLCDHRPNESDAVHARKLLRDQESKTKAQQLDMIQQLCNLVKQAEGHAGCEHCGVVQACPLPAGAAYRSRTMS